MSKFNIRDTRTAVTSPITTDATPTGHTHEGGLGYARDEKSELFLLAVANMVGEDTFYEAARNRDDRYRNLVTLVADQDPEWLLGFIRWLRSDANMRSAPIVAAATAVKVRLAVGRHGLNRDMVNASMLRADEPGEFLAYWTSMYGRNLPKPVKRGVADAVKRLYTQRSLLKYDTASHGFRFGDVIDLVHPGPDSPWSNDLYRHALDRRHNRDTGIPHTLDMLLANQALRAAAATDPTVLLDPAELYQAGMTWEDVLSLAGDRIDKRLLWEAIIPSMGVMALARNLRNFDEAGVSDEMAAQIVRLFINPDEVARSRMFPFRWLAAYRHAPSLRWGQGLERALTHSLVHVPQLSGRTLILVDLSGSMQSPSGGSLSQMTRADAAKVFGAALAMRAAQPTLVAYDTSNVEVPVPKAGSLLRLVESFPRMGGGTYTTQAVQRWFNNHDRVIIVTDEQTHYSAMWSAGGQSPTDVVPARVPVYTWNLAGYKMGHGPSGSGNRHTFGGLSDAAFRLIPLLEAGQSATWPWV